MQSLVGALKVIVKEFIFRESLMKENSFTGISQEVWLYFHLLILENSYFHENFFWIFSVAVYVLFKLAKNIKIERVNVWVRLTAFFMILNKFLGDFELMLNIYSSMRRTFVLHRSTLTKALCCFEIFPEIKASLKLMVEKEKKYIVFKGISKFTASSPDPSVPILLQSINVSRVKFRPTLKKFMIIFS